MSEDEVHSISHCFDAVLVCKPQLKGMNNNIIDNRGMSVNFDLDSLKQMTHTLSDCAKLVVMNVSTSKDSFSCNPLPCLDNISVS